MAPQDSSALGNSYSGDLPSTRSTTLPSNRQQAPVPRFASQKQPYTVSAPLPQPYPISPPQQQPYSVPARFYSSQQAPVYPPQQQSYSAPLNYLSQQPATSSYNYAPYPLDSNVNPPSSFTQPASYSQPYAPNPYDPRTSVAGTVPASIVDPDEYETEFPPAQSYGPPPAPAAEASYAQTTYQTPSYQPPAAQVPTALQPTSSGDSLAQVLVQDGADPQSFTSSKALADYLRVFPEADNDQGCRVLKYGPNCPTSLLMPLFEHFDFPRFSMFPYGFAGDFSTENTWGTGSCKCQKCMDGELCGHYVLQKNLQFYAYYDVTPSSSLSPKISSTQDATIISTGGSQFVFRKATWNLQLFRFRSRRSQTTDFAYDALIYRNCESDIKLRASPLDYVLSQLDKILSDWDSILNAASQFLSAFVCEIVTSDMFAITHYLILSQRVEVLEERLETDRSIIRNLVMAAQHWEEFRRVLLIQLQRIDFLKNVHGDPRWTEGRDNYFETIAIASGYVQKLQAIDYRISTDLIKETDNLIQRVTNLIAIDEGYRSRDQNASIRRLTWITFIFLPLIFTAGIFSMQVDLFNSNAAWQYYVYTALVLTIVVFLGYAILRSGRRILYRSIRIFGSLVLWLLRKLIDHLKKRNDRMSDRHGSGGDVEKYQVSPTDEISMVLKWAASSGRSDVVRNILQSSTKKTKLTPGMSGQALLMAIQNGHVEAANLLVDTGEGLTYRDVDNATVLHWAAKMGQSALCQRLLDKGVYKDAKDQNDQTALDWAMRGDDELTINVLLKSGRTFTRQETANLQSLHLSAHTGDIEMIKEFHRQGSSLEARDGKGQTVLFHAVKGRQHEIIKWLLSEGKANVQAIDKEGLTALHVAAQECDPQSAEILIEHDANVNALSTKHLTPLHCISNSEGVRVLILLHERGADINATDKNNNRITHKAAGKGDSASLLFKVAADLGADIFAPGDLGNAPAHLAASSGSKAILYLLHQRDPECFSTRNTAGYTPLMAAARAGKVAIMRYLLDQGVNHDVTDTNSRSLLELSIEWGNPEVMALLQQHGANYGNVTAASGRVHPVWKAVYDGHGVSVAKILDGGLSVEYEHRGVRLLQGAIEANNEEVVRLLLDRGAAVDIPDTKGWTALHSAAFTGDTDILLLILQKTDDQEPKDHQGWTPLDLAAFYKHGDIIKVLDPERKIKDFAWVKKGTGRIQARSFFVPDVGLSVIKGVAEAPHGVKKK